jgi:hypothetical protein
MAWFAAAGAGIPAACVYVAYSPPTNARDPRRSSPAITPRLRYHIFLIASSIEKAYSTLLLLPGG